MVDFKGDPPDHCTGYDQGKREAGLGCHEKLPTYYTTCFTERGASFIGKVWMRN